MDLKPEEVRSTHKVGPIRAYTIPVTIVACVVAYFSFGPIGPVVTFIALQFVWMIYATVAPNYLFKKMDGSMILVKKSDDRYAAAKKIYAAVKK